ncbi:hypothetical protein [Streptomyces fagopyri]|uniref:hypothetical protein n=1 Tax=Streptomyces fagopyri TaxID=2662397 RepID=UPI0033EA9E6A
MSIGAELQLRVNGEEVVAHASETAVAGRLRRRRCRDGGHGLLWATGVGRHPLPGEPECTGACCGRHSMLVKHRSGGVEWSDRQVSVGRVALGYDGGGVAILLSTMLPDDELQPYCLGFAETLFDRAGPECSSRTKLVTDRVQLFSDSAS